MIVKIRHVVDGTVVNRTLEAPKITGKIHPDGRGVVLLFNDDGKQVGWLLMRQVEDIDFTDQLLAH